VTILRDNLRLDRKNIMRFRREFEKVCGVAGFTNKEKDPDEFLGFLLDMLKSEQLLRFTYVIKILNLFILTKQKVN
jgi:hypothetical protein